MTSIEQQLLEDPFSFERVENKSEELALLAVSINPKVLAIIPEEYQTKAVCKCAIKQNAINIKFVKRPTMGLYNYAILNAYNVQDVLEYVPLLSDNVDVIRKIVRRIHCQDLYLVLKTNFHVNIWTEALILEILSGDWLLGTDLEIFIKFLRESGLQITNSIRKALRLKNGLNQQNLLVDWTEHDIRKSLESYVNVRLITNRNLLETMEVTLSEFYKSSSASQLDVLTYTKNIKEEMILYCAVRKPSDVINVCLRRGILTADLLVKIISTKFHTIKPQIDINNKSYTTSNIELLKRIDFTEDQLKTIYDTSPGLAKLCNKGIDVETAEQREKNKQLIRDQLKTAIVNNTEAIISTYLNMERHVVSNFAVLSSSQLKKELDNISKGPTLFTQISDHNDMFRVEKPGENEYLKAVEHDWYNLRFVPTVSRTLPVCIMAYQQRKNALQYIPDNLKNDVLDRDSQSTLKRKFRVVIIDKITMKNHRMDDWTIDGALEKLRREHNDREITFNSTFEKDSGAYSSFDFIKEGVVIKSVLVLN